MGRLKNNEECVGTSVYLSKKRLALIDLMVSKLGLKSRNQYFEYLIDNSNTRELSEEIRYLEIQEKELGDRIVKIKEKKLKLMDVDQIMKGIEDNRKLNRRKAVMIIRRAIVENRLEEARKFSQTWSLAFNCTYEELLAEAYGGIKGV